MKNAQLEAEQQQHEDQMIDDQGQNMNLEQ